MINWKGSQRLSMAAMIMAGSVFLSRAMGFIRDMTISRWFGAGQEADIYFTAFVVPDFLNYLMAGAYFSITLIPILAQAFEEDEASGWQMFSAIFCGMLLASSVLIAAAMVYAPELARLAAPGFDAVASARLTHFLRIILPAQVFFLVGSCLSAILYIRKQFLVPALTPICYNGAIIGLGALVLGSGIDGFCWGVLVGAFIGSLALPLLAVIRTGGLSLSLRFRHTGLRRFLLLVLPLMIGQSVVVLDEQLLRIFGSLAGTGAVSWLNYARHIMLVPVGMVAQAVGVASFPFLAQLAVQKESERFNATLAAALRTTTLLLLPLGVWMFAAAEPIVAVTFQQGQFGSADTAATVPCLRLMLVGVVAWGVLQIIGRAFYAYQDMLTPAVTGSIITLVALPLYWWFTRYWGANGAALVSLSAVVGYAMAIGLLWRRRFGSGGLIGLGRVCFWCFCLSLIAVLPAWLLLQLSWLGISPWPILDYTVALAVSVVCFIVVFLVFGQCYIPDLVRPVQKYLECLARLGRGGPAASV
ncbi:putative lipid II flippase MurJ [Desulfovibrionales bacterium]